MKRRSPRGSPELLGKTSCSHGEMPQPPRRNATANSDVHAARTAFEEAVVGVRRMHYSSDGAARDFIGA